MILSTAPCYFHMQCWTKVLKDSRMSFIKQSYLSYAELILKRYSYLMFDVLMPVQSV